MPLQKKFNDAVTDTVIFLDFDGPLSTMRVLAQTGDNLDFDPVIVGMIGNICEVAKARIVCTSVRTFPHDAIYHETKRLFDGAGLDISLLHPDWTVNKTDVMKRKDNIEAYLRAHPEITNYVIIDDEYVDMPDRLVQVSETDGVLSADLEKICYILGFDAGEVYKHARAKTHAQNQYTLPFDNMDKRMNRNIAEKKL